MIALIIIKVICFIILGALLENFGRFEEALLNYNKAIKLNPTNANTYNNKGYIITIF